MIAAAVLAASVIHLAASAENKTAYTAPLADLAGQSSPGADAQSDAAVGGAQQEVVADIQIRGNVATPDDEIRHLAGVAVGDAIGPGTIADMALRLRAANRFERIDVLKRFASLSDPTRIVLVIVVDEGPVSVERTGDPLQPIRVARKREGIMFMPVLRYEDGYGFIYGGELARPNSIGRDSRLAVPMTWGGEKRAALELERDFDARRTIASAGGSFDRRTHPFFSRDEDRGRVWGRLERELAPSVHAGVVAGWQHVSLAGAHDSFVHAGADVTFDNRLDPLLARNAVYGRVAWEHDRFARREAVSRWQLDGRAYIGFIGQSIVVLRAVREDASGALPIYLQPILGGIPTVRGFRLGTAIGDALTAASAELRLPLNSPMTIAKVGVSAFVDTGAVSRFDQSLSDQSLKTGVGGSVWLSVAFVRLNVIIAHGIGSSTRIQFGGAVAF